MPNPQPYAQLEVHRKMRVIPLKMVTRNARRPLLLKCHRVIYDQETNHLKLAEGEFVGHEVYGDIIEEDEEDEEYENTAIEGAENVLAGTITFEYSTSTFLTSVKSIWISHQLNKTLKIPKSKYNM